MFSDSNILLFLLAVVPGLIYSIVIFANSPRNQNLKLRLSLQYLLYGMLSIFAVTAIHFIFPHWMDYLEYTKEAVFQTTGPKSFRIDFIDTPTIFANIFHWFVQVGLTEEVCKALVFLLITGLRLKRLRIQDKPYAIMYYTMMVSMGFALVENVWYGMMFMNHPTQSVESVLLLRTVTSVVAHMTFGLIMGYFFALGFKNIRGYNSDQTIFNLWARTHQKAKRTILFTIGILAASFFHGMYDFILSIGLDWIVVAEFLVFGLVTTYLMSKNLVSK